MALPKPLVLMHVERGLSINLAQIVWVEVSPDDGGWMKLYLSAPGPGGRYEVKIQDQAKQRQVGELLGLV